MDCTCVHVSCKFHPSNNGGSCSACIEKNLRLREIPNCFFSLLGAADVKGRDDSFEAFATEVIKQKNGKQ